jgi:hypothetical protein
VSPRGLLKFCALSLFALFPACDSNSDGDPPAPVSAPPPGGKDFRINQIADPNSPTKAANGSTVSISGAAVVAVDNFDETHNGKSSGTIYVSDLGSSDPYSGISLFNPSFDPGTLIVGQGDVLDMRGQYQENQTLPVVFAPGAVLVQIASPLVRLRFDGRNDSTQVKPIEIKIEDLADYAVGRKWLNMLVTVKNVSIVGKVFGSGGRQSWDLLPEIPNVDRGCTVPFTKQDGAYSKVPTLVNELTDLAPIADKLAPDTVIKSITGVVTYFCNLHLAPRTPADIVL